MFRNKCNVPGRVTHLIVGLGNPDPAYDHTRHNIGKMFVKTLAKDLKLQIQITSDGFIAFHQHAKGHICLYCPNTFMNIQGKPIKKMFDHLRINDFQKLIVVQDDLESKIGVAKIKEGGSPEGHNGLKSIIDSFEGEKSFYRLKLGIDRPQSKDNQIVAEYVLNKFIGVELETIQSKAYMQAIQLLHNKGFL